MWYYLLGWGRWQILKKSKTIILLMLIKLWLFFLTFFRLSSHPCFHTCHRSELLLQWQVSRGSDICYKLCGLDCCNNIPATNHECYHVLKLLHNCIFSLQLLDQLQDVAALHHPRPHMCCSVGTSSLLQLQQIEFARLEQLICSTSLLFLLHNKKSNLHLVSSDRSLWGGPQAGHGFIACLIVCFVKLINLVFRGDQPRGPQASVVF